MTHKITLRSIEPVTHNVNRLVFDRPDGYQFRPGEATLFRLDEDGWRDEKRPFTFTSLPDDDYLEFTIKSYPDHNGVTEKIAKLKPGDTVLIGDSWGAIEDKGPGVFIAGGAGITPFIAILRARMKREGHLNRSTLIFANETERDIILRDEWVAMEGLSTIFTLTKESSDTLPHRDVDADFLTDVVNGWREVFYVCGPRKMEDDVSAVLRQKGVPEDKIVTEDHPD